MSIIDIIYDSRTQVVSSLLYPGVWYLSGRNDGALRRVLQAHVAHHPLVADLAPIACMDSRAPSVPIITCLSSSREGICLWKSVPSLSIAVLLPNELASLCFSPIVADVLRRLL